MKKFLLGFLSLMVAIYCNAQPVKQHGQLRVDSTQLIDRHGKPVMLRGASFGWHNFWPRFYNAGAVHTLAKDWHCNVVRAAMGVEPERGYLKDPAGAIQNIETVVDAAIREGIYVIIDWHSHNIQLQEATGFFSKMATKYGKYPNVIYEIFNEPDHESWKEVKSYSAAVIAAIRAIDPNNIILVGNPHWDQDIHLVADDPITGSSNIMYTVHFYAATHKQFLRDRCEYALKKGIPIFISESAGMEASGNGSIDDAEWNKWIEWSEKNKISWITWSVSDKDETCSMLQKTASSEGKWKTEDLKGSGIQLKALLEKYADK